MTNYSVNNLTTLRNLQVCEGETALVVQDKNSLWIRSADGEYFGWHKIEDGSEHELKLLYEF